MADINKQLEQIKTQTQNIISGAKSLGQVGVNEIADDIGALELGDTPIVSTPQTRANDSTTATNNIISSTTPIDITGSGTEFTQPGTQPEKTGIVDRVKSMFGITAPNQTQLLDEGTEFAEGRTGLGLTEETQKLNKFNQQIVGFTTQIATLDQQERDDINRIRESSGSTLGANKQIREIQDQYNERKASIATQMSVANMNAQLAQGNVALINEYADDFVNAATYKEETEYNRYNDFIIRNPLWWKSLPEEERKVYEEITGMKKQELDEKKDRLTSLKDMYISQGLTMPVNMGTMSVEAVEKDLATKIRAEELRKERLDTGGGDILSSLDIQRYSEQYPLAGIRPGDTLADVTRKISETEDKQYEIYEIIVQANMDQNNTLEETIEGINSDPTILDKSKAIAVAERMFGGGETDNTKQKSVEPGFFETLKQVPGTIYDFLWGDADDRAKNKLEDVVQQFKDVEFDRKKPKTFTEFRNMNK